MPSRSASELAHSEGFTSPIRVEDFRLVEQKKYEQKNVTVGRIVPVEVFLSEVFGARSYEFQEVMHGTNP
jgi:hypothetical protein